MTTLLNLHDDIPDADEEKLADKLRTLGFWLVSQHPMAASLLEVDAYCLAAGSKTDLNITRHLWGGVP